MNTRPKRILWLLNHTTLRKSEVPLLIKLGFEVFTPKKMPREMTVRSGSITNEYDQILTIPPKLLQQLNGFDFYSTSHWPESIVKSVNQHFDILVCQSSPLTGKLINASTKYFKGNIFLRAFGVLGELENHAKLFSKVCNKHAIERMKSQDQIWFAPSYPNLIGVEPYWIKRISVYLPLGLPPSYYLNEKQWRQSENKIFFVCPHINDIEYYQNVYREFIATFRGIPYTIAGAQPVAVKKDPNVVGYLSQNQFENILKTYAVMFYQSREERHLHYHPLEAMLCGMPVIYMAGSMLDYIAGEMLPGCCETLQEARHKVARILSGDADFIHDVVESQKAILDVFSPEYVEQVWMHSFLPIVMGTQQKPESVTTSIAPTAITKVGIWMHETSLGGFTGEGISRLLALIVRAAQARPDMRISIACVSWVKDTIIDYMDELGVDIHKLDFITLQKSSPVLITLYNWWAKRKPSTKIGWPKLSGLLASIRRLLERSFKRLVSLRGWLGGILIGLVAIAALPLAIIYGFYKLIQRFIPGITPRLLSSRAGIYTARNMVLWKEMSFAFARRLYNNVVEAELELLADKASKKKDIDVWYFPYPRNNYIDMFKTPIVVGVPDIVYINFPTIFGRQLPELLYSHDSIVKTILRADKVITFSEFVKNNHIAQMGYQTKDNIRVIRHAPVDTIGLISDQARVHVSKIRYRASRIIKEYLKDPVVGKTKLDIPYLQSLPFGEFNYLFVSSQTRPHKNHINLLKAFRILLRERYINLKLVFTGEFSPEMEEYIQEEKLHLDVISLHYLPPKVHAAFYACAKLVIAPTLFEGGFPFIFSEALSVGTPVLMSDIPVVREVFSDAVCNTVCFDPYDINSLVARTIWALENETALLDLEKHLYMQMKQRTWEHVADEYIAVIQSIIKKKDSFERQDNQMSVESHFPVDIISELPAHEHQPFDTLIKSNKQLCFLHIPKTAGTSFVSILDSLFSQGTFREIGWQKIFSNEDIVLDELTAFSGHIPYEIGKILTKEPVFLTFLRNPIERALSQYEQSRRYPQHWAYQRLQQISLEDYVNDINLQGEIANVQAWVLGLSLDSQIRSVRDLMNPKEYTSEIIDEINKNPTHPVWTLGLHIGINPQVTNLSRSRTVSIELAKQRLNEIAFFGLTERFRESTNLFSYTFGFWPLTEIPNLRAAAKHLRKNDIPTHVLEKIRQLNLMDIELYEYAEQLFETRYDQMLTNLRDQFQESYSTSTIEELLDRRYWKDIPKTDKLLYQFDHTIPRSGWHEPTRVDGRQIVWSGPHNNSTVDLPLDRKKTLAIRFPVVGFVHTDILESMSLFVDAKPILLSRELGKDRVNYFQGIILADTNKKEETPTRLSFRVNRTAYPYGTTIETPDTRLIGIALSWIEITPA